MPDPTRHRRRRVRLAELLGDDSIVFDASAPDRDAAVRLVGELLVSVGAVDRSYVDGMLAREHSVSTYVGEQIAFPHATSATEGSVLRDAVVVVRFAEPVPWEGEHVAVAVGIAAAGRGHIGILSQLASALLEPAAATALRTATTRDEVRALLDPT